MFQQDNSSLCTSIPLVLWKILWKIFEIVWNYRVVQKVSAVSMHTQPFFFWEYLLLHFWLHWLECGSVNICSWNWKCCPRTAEEIVARGRGVGTNMFVLMSFIHRSRIHCTCLFMLTKIRQGFWAKSSSGGGGRERSFWWHWMDPQQEDKGGTQCGISACWWEKHCSVSLCGNFILFFLSLFSQKWRIRPVLAISKPWFSGSFNEPAMLFVDVF